MEVVGESGSRQGYRGVLKKTLLSEWLGSLGRGKSTNLEKQDSDQIFSLRGARILCPTCPVTNSGGVCALEGDRFGADSFRLGHGRG